MRLRPLVRASTLLMAVTLTCGAGGTANSQDFAGAGVAAADDGAFTLLEHALPSRNGAPVAATSQTRWWGLPDLETRAAAIGGGWRSLRAACGVSQTGVPDLGWTALAAAAGGANTTTGAGVRACARLDRDVPWSASRAMSPAAGLELGAGAWLVPVENVRVWAIAPQLYTYGAPPPLVRSLELGVRAGEETGAWVRLRAPRAGDDGERALGVSIVVVPATAVTRATAWAEVRDAPLRGAAGIGAALGTLGVEARVDAHPLLGETVRVALSWRGRTRRAS